MKEREFILKLSLYELRMLEAEMEFKCQRLFEMNLSFEREKTLLEKIYKASPLDKGKRLKIK